MKKFYFWSVLPTGFKPVTQILEIFCSIHWAKGANSPTIFPNNRRQIPKTFIYEKIQNSVALKGLEPLFKEPKSFVLTITLKSYYREVGQKPWINSQTIIDTLPVYIK